MQITLNIPDNLPADIVAQYIESIEKQIALLAKGFNQTKPVAVQKTTQTESEKVLQLLEKYELLGCMEGDGNLSETYKQHLWK